MIKQKICIIGNGLTGLTAALILGRLNLDVHLIATPEGENRKDLSNYLEERIRTVYSSALSKKIAK